MKRIANGTRICWGKEVGVITGYSAGSYRVATFVNGNYSYEWWPAQSVKLYETAKEKGTKAK